jgi:hypothetical protein
MRNFFVAREKQTEVEIEFRYFGKLTEFGFCEPRSGKKNRCTEPAWQLGTCQREPRHNRVEKNQESICEDDRMSHQKQLKTKGHQSPTELDNERILFGIVWETTERIGECFDNSGFCLNDSKVIPLSRSSYDLQGTLKTVAERFFVHFSDKSEGGLIVERKQRR